MDIIEMTRSLGHAIQQEESFKKLMKAQNACDNDPVLQDMIGEFNLARMDAEDDRHRTFADEAEFQESGFDIEDAPEDAGADIDADFDDE